jgi:hypothetical protein
VLVVCHPTFALFSTAVATATDADDGRCLTGALSERFVPALAFVPAAAAEDDDDAASNGGLGGCLE